MSSMKVVVRFANGKIIKGSTSNFSPHEPEFHVFPVEGGAMREGIRIVMKDLKAVFVVKDFLGNPEYQESTSHLVSDHLGDLMEVEFLDGEVVIGNVSGYNVGRQGFFIVPIDPNNNNLKVFVVYSAIREAVPVNLAGFIK